MLHGDPKLLILCLLGGFATACGGSAKSAKADKADGPLEVDGVKKSTPEDGGIELEAFEFGAYLAEPPEGFATKQVSVEFGYFDVREQKNGDKDDIDDYRFKQAAVFVQDSHLPQEKAADCAVVKTRSGEKNPAKSVKFSGGVSGEKDFAKGFAKIAGNGDDSGISTLEALKVSITGLGSAAVEAESPTMPTDSAIQLAGAIDANVTVNTFIKDINSNLEKSDADLLIGDVATGKDYNLIVVTFYPSASAAEATPVRCFLPAAGSATLAKAKYKKMLPFRAILGHFANVSVTTQNDVTIWAAAISGQGAEDLTVK